jgi:hypothetical protein
MERIIYLDTELGFKYADIKNHHNLLSSQRKLNSCGYFIVCVLDLDSHTIVERCESFSSHAAFIQSCYPNVDLSVDISQHSQSAITQLAIA